DDNDDPTTSYLATTSTDATALSATVSKKTSLGITFSSTLSSSKSQTDNYSMAEKGDDLSKSSTGEEVDSSSLSATVSIPLFQDWGDVNDLPVKRSQILLDQAKATTYSTGVGLLESVANEYWNLVGVQENIKTLKEAVNLSEKLVRETRARVQVGVLNPTDLKETQTQLANNRKDLLTKQIEEQETEDKIRVALDLGTIPFGFKPADLPRIHGEDFNFQELLNKAYENSTDLKTLMISLKSNQYDLDDAYNSDKTDLDLSLTYTLNGYGDSPSETTQYYSNDEYQGYSATLTWNVPLFDDSASETIMQRKIERSKLELQIKDAKAEIYVSLQTILRNLKFGIEEEKAAQLSVNLAKDLLDKEVEKLKIGKSTSYNVSQAQKNYTDAKLGETLVRVGNERNFVKLLVLTGDIFSYYKLPKSL
ncbi:MAG: TolC family protein, partial [Proteobacteria bacterium]|nr:TolC family protein [Pseudomonadota bacterium]